MMLAHVEFIDNGLQVRSRALYGQDAFLLELLVRHASVLHIPRCIFKHAVRLPHVDQLLADCPTSAVISEAVPDGLH